jgi:hypothetical protein
MTETAAWDEGITDARRTLQAHLDTIDELNRHASDTLRFNAVIVSIVVAGLYRTSPGVDVVAFVFGGTLLIGVGSYLCFRLLQTGPVSGGVPPAIYEDLSAQNVSSEDYYDHVGGVIYPRAIRDAREHSNHYSDVLEDVYKFSGAGLVVLALGGAYMYGTSTGLPEGIQVFEALLQL